MKARLRLLITAVGLCLPSPLQAQSGGDEPALPTSSLLPDITYLASDAMDGRGTGTAGDRLAALFIARRYHALQLIPVFSDSTCPTAGACAAVFFQGFRPPSDVLRRAELPQDVVTQNVAGLLPGTDPVLRREVIVVGAHYDHLGRTRFATPDTNNIVSVRNGADDNASGTVAMLELARRLTAAPTRRSILFVAFAAEEIGLIGSAVFLERPPLPLEAIVTMINLDMVGRMRGNRVSVYGSNTAAGLNDVLDSARVGMPLKVSAPCRLAAPSDHLNFIAKRVPALHFFTGLHDDYHRDTDDVSRLNMDGISKVIDLAERVIRLIADREERLLPAAK